VLASVRLMPETPPATATRSFPHPLFLLTVAGLGLRALFLLLEPGTQPIADERTWTNWAVEVLLSDRVRLNPLRTNMLFYPPVYPYFIALTYAPFASLTAVKWAQILVSAALIPAVGRVGALVYGARVGLVAAAVVAFYPDLVWFSVHFWSETLFLTLLWWAFERLLAADRAGSTRLAVMAGLLWGLSILTRETALYFTPLAAAWLAWRPRAAGGLARAGAFLFAALLVVSPWTWRNSQRFPGAFVPVSTAGGLNLWQANAGIPRYRIYELYDAVEGGRVAQYRHARRKGLEAIWERQPTWFFEKLYSEMPLFWDTDTQGIIHIQRGGYGPPLPLAAVAAALVLTVPYLIVLAFFVLGLAAWRFDRSGALLLAYLAFHNFLHVVTHGFARYRLSVMPVVFLIAAGAFVAWRSGSLVLTPRRRVLAGVLTLIFALLLAPALRSQSRHPAFDLRSPLTPAEPPPRQRGSYVTPATPVPPA